LDGNYLLYIKEAIENAVGRKSSKTSYETKSFIKGAVDN